MTVDSLAKVESVGIKFLPITRTRTKLLDEKLVEKMYAFIQAREYKVTTEDMFKVVGNKDTVRRVLTRLTVSRRIRRIKTFGEHGIIYTYTTKVK